MYPLSVAVLNKKTGEMVRKISAGIALNTIQLETNQILSWEYTVFAPGPEFDWKTRILKFGTASAYVVATRGPETQKIPNVEMRIEGDPADVVHLIEEVTRLLDGEVLNLGPVSSWWRHFIHRCKRLKAEVEAYQSSNA